MSVETLEPIEELARAWLAAERRASERGNADGTEDAARLASATYDSAIVAASREELLLAWHAAQRRQAAAEMGSREWVEARAVSELLRVEYQASA